MRRQTRGKAQNEFHKSRSTLGLRTNCACDFRQILTGREFSRG